MRDFPSSKDTILIAEDDAEVLKFVSTILQDRGFNVITASGANDALTRARNFSGEIKVLLTDVAMGKLDGFDLRERLLLERPKVKVVVMSGRLDDDFEAQDFILLRKPFTPMKLIAAIESQI